MIEIDGTAISLQLGVPYILLYDANRTDLNTLVALRDFCSRENLHVFFFPTNGDPTTVRIIRVDTPERIV